MKQIENAMTMVQAIERAVRVHSPGRTVRAIKDRGAWIRHIIEVTLDGGEAVILKLNLDPAWADVDHEEKVAQIFGDHGLPAPRVLVVDASRKTIPYPYIIQEKVGGTRLGTLIDQVGEADTRAIYETLGCFYSKMHAVHNDWSGIWRDIPNKPLPNDFMYKAEIIGGSAKRALEQGQIAQRTYDRAVALWAEHLDYLKDHQPSLIHYSAFPWTIYLERDNDDWRITKLTSLGDVMWWDPAYDLACLRYPPFGEVKPGWWEAFLRGYGGDHDRLPERERMLLYAIMQRFCAAMGVYMEPQSARNKAWAKRCLVDVDIFMDEIKRVG